MFCIKRIFKLLRIGLVCLRKLLSFGVNPDVEDGVGRSPLQWAASAGILMLKRIVHELKIFRFLKIPSYKSNLL